MQVRRRLPVEVVELGDGLRSLLGIGHQQQRVGAGVLQRDQLAVDRRVGGLEVLGVDDHRLGLVTQCCGQPVQHVLAEIVVLVEHGDPGVGFALQDMCGIERGLGLQVGLPAHRPGEVSRIVEGGGTGGDEELRHLLLVEVAADRHVERRAQHVEHRGDLVALDQLAGILHHLGRRVAVVEADEVDLAAVDAALGVQSLEVGRFRLAELAVGRGRSAIGDALSDLDFGRRGAGTVLRLCERARRPERHDGRGAHHEFQHVSSCFL